MSVLVMWSILAVNCPPPTLPCRYSGFEDFLRPLQEARDLIEKLAMEELAIGEASERTRYTVRGPLLGRMELICQLFHNQMHTIPLNLGEFGLKLEKG